MGAPYTPSSAGPLVLVYQQPADGDPDAAASFNPTTQGLADDIARLANGKQASNTIPRTYGHFEATSGWSRIQTDWVQTDVTAQQWLCLAADFPHGAQLTSLSFGVIAAGAHAALPANMPQFQLFKKNVGTGAVTTIGAVIVDPSVSTAAYQASHLVSVTGLTEIIDRTTYTYGAWFQGEYAPSGTGCVAGLKVSGAIGTFTISGLDQGAG